MTNSRRHSWALVTVAVLFFSACTEADGPPASATVVVEASASEETPLELTVSTRFDVDAEGVITYRNADTIAITGNYNERFSLNAEARFVAKLLNTHETEAQVRLSVLIDDNRRDYDESIVLGQGGFLAYLYRFQANTGF